MTRPSRALFVFLDGVGIGPADHEVNPFLARESEITALRALMGGRVPTLEAPRVEGAEGYSFPLDATLGVEGTPQSGTGQTALLTGESAAELFGRHFGPWAPVRLRPLVEERSVLRRGLERGLTVSFANAYPENWPGSAGQRRVAAAPLAAYGASLLVRHAQALAEGRAVASEIVNDGWRDRLGHTSLPCVTPERAGENLARISREADLTFFAHYATDTAGHRRSLPAAVASLRMVDGFVSGIRATLDADTLLLVASDHGNLEDIRVGHTRNPVLGMAAGPGAAEASRLSDIRDVAGFLLDLLAPPADATG